MPSEAIDSTEILLTFPFTIHMPHALYQRTFDNKEVLDNWCTQERSNWKLFAPNAPDALKRSVNAQCTELQNILLAAGRYVSKTGAEWRAARLELSNAISNLNKNRYFPYDSPITRAIIDAEEAEAGMGCALLASMRGDTLTIPIGTTGQSIDISQVARFAEQCRMLNHEYWKEMERKGKEYLSLMYENKIEAEGYINDLNNDISTELDKLDIINDRYRTSFREFKEMYADAKTRLAELEQKYKVEQEYGEAVRYWKHKRWWHTGTKYGAMIVLAALLYKPIDIFLTNLPNLQKSLESFATTNERTLVPLAVILSFIAFCYVSAVRFMTRFYSEHHADGEDAHLRETLIKTYLAMRKDDEHKLNEGERLLALHALFRGSARAPTADDTPPVNTLEALINTLKPGGGKG